MFFAQFLRRFLLLSIGLALTCRAAEVCLQILQTTDIHGHVMAEPGEAGSWYQLGTLIREQRESFGEDRTLLFDTGDTIQGTMLASLSRGEACLVPLRNLRYDGWVPGNHEPDFGLGHFFDLAEDFRDLILCGNLFPEGRAPYTAWRLFVRGGARIAVIGMTASYMKNWLPNRPGEECRVTLAVDEMRTLLPEILREKPDMIVLACHQAWLEGTDPRNVNEVAAIARMFPEIDLILGAHSHRVMPGHRIGNGTWYVQPGCHGRELAVITVRLDTEQHKVLDISSKIRRVSQRTPGDSRAILGLDGWLRRTRSTAAERLTPALPNAVGWEGRPGVDCQASELFCLALAKASNAKIAFHGVLAKKQFEADKPVTGRDLFEFVPYENTIFTAWLTPDEIGRIVAEQWAKRDIYTYCGIWGAEVRLETGGAIVTSIDGHPPVKGQRYLVAFNSFTAAGSGRYPVLKKLLAAPDARLTDTGVSTRQAVGDYLKSRRDWPLRPKTWLSLE